MELTHEGEILLQAAEEIFPVLDGAAREIRRSADGRTRIRVCLKSAADFMSGMFAAFAMKRPQVIFDIADEPENCDVMPITCAKTVSYQLMKEFTALDMGVALAASINWNASGSPSGVKLVSIEGRPCRYIYLQERGNYRPECLSEFVEFLKDSFTVMQMKHPVGK